MYKDDSALNNLYWLICLKNKPNLIIYIQYICIKGLGIKLPTMEYML